MCDSQSAWQNYAKLKILLVVFALSKLTIIWSNRFFCPSHVACFALDLQGLDLEKVRLQATLPIFSLETSLQISSVAMSTSSWRRTLRCTCRLRRKSSKWPNAVAVNFTLSNPTGARRRMLKELGNPISGSDSTSERECKRCCSPDDIQLIALLEALLHACTLSGSSRPTGIMSKVQLKKCRVTSTGHRIRVPNTSSCPECRRPGEGWAWGV